MSTRYHNQSNQQPYYKTTASHNISNHSPSHTHISRWSSMQTTGTQGLWRGTSGGRYATTLTRQHIKKHHDPIEMVVKHTVSLNDFFIIDLYVKYVCSTIEARPL